MESRPFSFCAWVSYLCICPDRAYSDSIANIGPDEIASVRVAAPSFLANIKKHQIVIQPLRYWKKSGYEASIVICFIHSYPTSRERTGDGIGDFLSFDRGTGCEIEK